MLRTATALSVKNVQWLQPRITPAHPGMVRYIPYLTTTEGRHIPLVSGFQPPDFQSPLVFTTRTDGPELTGSVFEIGKKPYEILAQVATSNQQQQGSTFSHIEYVPFERIVDESNPLTEPLPVKHKNLVDGSELKLSYPNTGYTLKENTDNFLTGAFMTIPCAGIYTAAYPIVSLVTGDLNSEILAQLGISGMVVVAGLALFNGTVDRTVIHKTERTTRISNWVKKYGPTTLTNEVVHKANTNAQAYMTKLKAME